MKKVEIIEGKVCREHVHMYVAIPLKLSISQFMTYLKGKSTLLTDIQNIDKNEQEDILGVRGYYVSTVGNINEETIVKYIKEQEENDKIEDGIK